MGSVPLIFCERTGRWALSWRRHVAAGAMQARAAERLIEVRSSAACRDELVRHPAAFTVVELDARTDAALALLWRITHDFPKSHCAVVADRAAAGYESLCRELGALHFVSSPRRLSELAPLVAWHVLKQPVCEPSLRDAIWARLPWRPAAPRPPGTRGAGGAAEAVLPGPSWGPEET